MLLIFLTSCNLTSQNSKPTVDSAYPDPKLTDSYEQVATPTYIPMETETLTPQSSTLTPTPEYLTSTSTQPATNTPDRPTQIPTPSPTKKLEIKPPAAVVRYGTMTK